ncbi:Type I inositol polyphosphate 5-phosphatase 5 [Cinnamomum micranthum f. kanehirae]|uniref:Type I inositol polyphosphate 5-phosphatase 5 n=1 Tax=Cinnamomum micranthum f. kanehirae TaxID=337451 RepID=A0A3S3MEM8_9MAGN|nr:Type I inositol polyphosphate 5-phosphatase 5 [Cinnamomum micranthum f. kanehirae]
MSSLDRGSNSEKTTTTTTITTNTTTSTTPDDNSVKNDRKKKSILPKIFGTKGKNRRNSDDDVCEREDILHDLDQKFNSSRTQFMDNTPTIMKSFSESHASSRIEGLNLSNYDRYMNKVIDVQEFRIFVATWNVAGRCPHSGFNLEDFLQVEESSDIYVIGFQEIVPLNAGNVLVIEDSEPAHKWLSLISQALNMPTEDSRDDCSYSSHRSAHSQKQSLKAVSKNLKVESALLKSCNCNSETMSQWRKTIREVMQRPKDDGSRPSFSMPELSSPNHLNYSLIASKQMVGLFLSVWVRSELIPHIAHGCIAVSMTFHKTSFCFVCCHLASGEKEGDELKRNADVAEILKSTHQVIWLGDLNYRIALSYEETRVLLEANDWDALLRRDQLIIEKEAGRVFDGWKEGKILFAPTYKYTHNSDSYAGETVKSKKKRRTPAWCDRILWHGNGMEQVSYTRGESRFSDHRPVCAIFLSGVELPSKEKGGRKPFYSAGERIQLHDCIPQRHSFYEL